MKKVTLIFWMVCLTGILQAQEFNYDIRLTHFFDNREFDNQYALPQTLFGIRLSPELEWKKQDIQGADHSIHVGIHYLQPIGGTIKLGQLDPIVFYQYKKGGYNLHFGVVPFSELIEKLPLQVMSDSLSYVYPNIQGALFQYQSGKSFFEGMLDWRGAMSSQTREAFRVILKGRYYLGNFSLGGITFLNHLANKAPTQPKEGVCDDYLVSPEIGFHLDKNKILDTTSIRLGYIFAYSRERITNTSYQSNGLLLDLFVKWHFLALQNSFYVGNNLMPLYEKYGSGLHLGDPFYRASRYNRTSLMLYLIDKEFVTCTFSWNLHFTKGDPIGHQQLLNLRIKLDQLTFKH